MGCHVGIKPTHTRATIWRVNHFTNDTINGAQQWIRTTGPIARSTVQQTVGLSLLTQLSKINGRPAGTRTPKNAVSEHHDNHFITGLYGCGCPSCTAPSGYEPDVVLFHYIRDIIQYLYINKNKKSAEFLKLGTLY